MRKNVTFKTFFITWLMLGAIELPAQVANNNITQRSQLSLDERAQHSNTAYNSVEWHCINKSLTNKCLVYHNDQWFYFKPATNGKYFLNISSQQCQKKQGVQLIVIEGNPCEISTYQILKCIPKIYQEDVFIALDSLKANAQYLVNVDGFLGDFCEFDIQFSSKPQGFPQVFQLSDTINLKTELNNEIVSLHWNVNQSSAEALQHFEVFARKVPEVNSALKGKVQLKSNALGKFVEEYSFTDTLTTNGEFLYTIIAVDRESGMRRVVGSRSITLILKAAASKEVKARVYLSFIDQGRVEVSVFNLKDKELLNYWIHDYHDPETILVDLTKFVQAGIQQFQVKLRHNKTRESKVYDFQLNGQGEVERMVK